jgi:hypothetical protein
MNYDGSNFLATKKFPLYFFIGAFLFTFLFYYAGHEAILMDDALWGVHDLKTQGLQGYRISFGTNTFYYGHYLFIILLYGLFGMNHLAWFIVFCLLHALNVVFIFRFFSKLFQSFFRVQHGLQIAFLGAVLFLVSSYQSENIIWGATSHYAISLLLFLKIGINLLYYFETGLSSKNEYLNCAFYAYALVTLEISFLFPLLFFILFAILYFADNTKVSWRKYFIRILLPQILLVAVYVTCYYAITGHLLPPDRGDGESVTLLHQWNTLIQEVVKVFSFVNYTDMKTREYVYYVCTQAQYTMPFGIILYLFVAFGIYRVNKHWLWLYGFMSSGVLVFSMPFIRLYFVYLTRIETDRYVYFPSVFLFPFFVFLLYQLNSWLRIGVMTGYVMLFVFFGWKNVKARNMSGKLNHHFLTRFPKNTESKIYLLNIPSYCADAYMYRGENRFDIAFYSKYNYSPKHVTQVAWYNAQSDLDSFAVKKINDSSFHVQLKTNGSWWMKASKGATNYATDDYRFELDPWGGYQITFKHKLNAAEQILLFTGKGFQKVN